MADPVNTYRAAKKYIARGWSVIPLWCHNPKAKAVPALKTWTPFQTARPTERDLRTWFVEPRNLGIVTGCVSGRLVIRDFDTADGYPGWAEENSDLAATLPTVKTPRGHHVYARVERDDQCEFFKVVDEHGGETGEYRGDSKHFTQSPPSVRADGGRYEWMVPLPPIGEDLPLVDPKRLFRKGETFSKEKRLSKPSSATEQTEADRKQTEGQRRLTDAVIGNVIGEIGEIIAVAKKTCPSKEGERNSKIFEYVRHLMQLFDPKTLTDEDHQTVFEAWYDLAVDVIGTDGYDLNFAEYLQAVHNAHTPFGEHFWKRVLDRAVNADPPKWVYPRSSNETRLLASLCREAQRVVGPGEVWFLSCRKAGDYVGLSYQQANKVLNSFEHRKKLRCTKRGIYGGDKANRYLYIGDDL
jgi:hypothetical protein